MNPSSLKTHDKSACAGHHCCIHNPSSHHMRDWPMNWRADKGVMERICPHGIGHPDPDDAEYNERRGMGFLNIHGCDGCCDNANPSVDQIFLEVAAMSPKPQEDKDPYESEEYHKFVQSMVEHCHCEPYENRPCDGVLAGGLCDGVIEIERRDDGDDE